jgi:hypothetical protein
MIERIKLALEKDGLVVENNLATEGMLDVTDEDGNDYSITVEKSEEVDDSVEDEEA